MGKVWKVLAREEQLFIFSNTQLLGIYHMPKNCSKCWESVSVTWSDREHLFWPLNEKLCAEWKEEKEEQVGIYCWLSDQELLVTYTTVVAK